MLASQYSAFLCFIAIKTFLETDIIVVYYRPLPLLLYIIDPYLQYEFQRLSACLSMLNYNYTDRPGHLIPLTWPIFMRLTDKYIYEATHMHIYVAYTYSRLSGPGRRALD